MAPKLTIDSTLTLPNTNLNIPQLGFGVYLSAPEVTTASCKHALAAGYRHIDSAQYYENEAEVGAAVRESGIPRPSVFITTKILFAQGSVESSLEACRESVRKIDGDNGYVDLFLIHTQNFGSAKRKEMWQALEALQAEGKTKAIGVSNWGIASFEEMKAYAKVWPPTVNQIELHPWHQQKELVEYCEKNNIVVEAYCPIVRNTKADDATLSAIAKKHGKNTAQVLIRYALQRGWVPLPKSDTPSRIKSNADVYDFELTDEDMAALNALDEGAAGGTVQTVDNGVVEPTS